MSAKPTYDELNQKLEELHKKALENDSIIDQLAPIFNYSPDMIGSGNLKGYFMQVNPSFENILGYTKQDFLQTPFVNFVHEEDVEETTKALQAAAQGKQEIYIENRYRCKDGSYRWIDWRVQAFLDKNLFVAVGRDITEKKTLEEELRRSERRYRQIIQTSNDGFLQTDEQGRITDCNSAYLRMSGYNRDELLAMNVGDLDAVEDQDDTVQHISRLIEGGGGCFESVHKRKDGSTQDVEVSTTFIATENIFVAFIKDITEYKHTIAVIKENEERFRQLAENIPEVFWLGSLDWQEVYYISPAYEEIWGKSPEEIYHNSLSWIDSILEEDREKVLKTIPDRIDESVRSIIFPEYRIRHSNGTIRWIRARAFPIKDENDRLYRIAGIAEDITQLKEDVLEKEKLVLELKLALQQVKTLSGFLPICASCKKIRDDKGYWEQIETYISKHSAAEFSHSICPECTKILYPEFADENGKIKKR